ncbi:MAG: hypothetical protein OXC31_26720 [Spirochaetaceae bacterium]|nr:hypothetical protein [Spirochaetaceae bacterium]
MADQTVDTDYSGRPLRPIEDLEEGEVPPIDLLIAVLQDGTEVVDWGGEYYHLDADGRPDFDRPLDPRLLT